MRAIDIIPLTGVRAHPRQDYRLRLVTGREQGAGSKRTLRHPARRPLGPRPWALPPLRPCSTAWLALPTPSRSRMAGNGHPATLARNHARPTCQPVELFKQPDRPVVGCAATKVTSSGGPCYELLQLWLTDLAADLSAGEVSRAGVGRRH